MKYILFILLFFTSCSSSELDIPSDIIQKEKMINVMVDVHIADAMASEQKIKDIKVSNQLKKTYLVGVLHKHDISQQKFDNSIQFYESNVETMLDIYNEVMIKISAQEAELNNKETEK